MSLLQHLRAATRSISFKVAALSGAGMIILSGAVLGTVWSQLDQRMEEQGIQAQEAAIHGAWSILEDYGKDYQVADNRIMAGETTLNGNDKLVDLAPVQRLP